MVVGFRSGIQLHHIRSLTVYLSDPESMGDCTVMGVENPGVVRRIGGTDLGVMARYTEVLPGGWCAQHVALGVLGEHQRPRSLLQT